MNVGRGTGFRIDASLRNLGSSVDMVQECALHMSQPVWQPPLAVWFGPPNKKKLVDESRGWGSG